MQQPSLPTYQISEANLIYVVWVDELVHTTEHPFCLDLEGCPCHDDSNLVREYVTRPLDLGLMTNSEAMRLYFGTQLVPTQDDERITDEEIEAIMAAPSPLDEEIDDLDDSKQQWLSEHL